MKRKIFISMIAAVMAIVFAAPAFAAPGGRRPGRTNDSQQSSAVTVAENTVTYNASQTAEVETIAEDTLPKALGNGSFENTVITESDFGTGVHTNGASAHGSGKWCLESSPAFEAWTNWKDSADEQFYWKTTSLQGYLELGVDDSLYPNRSSYIASLDFYAREGTQFAELVANETASLYQNISTEPGEILSWGLSHRSRNSNDIMALFIGPMQDYSYTKATSGGKDIFMWMGKLLNQNGLYTVLSGSNIHECSAPLTVYSKPEISIGSVDDSNYTEYFSLTKTTEITQEWICWIIQDTYEAWGDFVGTYEVPEGQSATTFAFTALSSSTNYESYPNEGNLLDAIKFTYAYPLSVASTGGGYGTVTADDADADGNVVENVTVTYDSTHRGNYLAGTGITINAVPADANHKFVGANVNGVFYDADYFTQTNGVYSYTFTIEAPEYIQLIFSKQATVVYDPNEGTYKGIAEDTEIKMSSSSSEGVTVWNNSEDAVSSDSEKIRFIGWYFARGGQLSDGTYTGALIKSNHTVTYNTQNTTQTSDDTLDVSYTNTSGTTNSSTIPADYGVTFVAQWEYLQKVVAMTKQTSEATYKESNVGGSVTMEIEDSDNQSDSERSVDAGATSSQGYGRLNDVITLRATVAPDSYVFMGWYDENGNVISHSPTYSYAATDYNTIYARFSADVVYPYLSFISEKSNPATNELVFKGGSHVRVGDEYVWRNKNNIGGEGIYGNTIATGFTLNTKGATGYTYDYCQWTITIPSGGTYVKVPDGANISEYPFTFEDTAILSDTNAQVNNGTIWKVSNINTSEQTLSLMNTGFYDIMDGGSDETLSIFVVGGFDDIESGEYLGEMEFVEEESAVLLNEVTGEVVLRLYDVLPTVITGESVITYGIVIDNVYAPQASAAFELISGKAADTGFKDISADKKGEVVHANSAEEYRESPNNEYSGVDTGEVE